MAPGASQEKIFALERPHPNLWVYYLIQSLAVGPCFPFLLIPRSFRYQTLRYRFDEEGLSIRWGVLFRREVHLTYSRIQDIHLRSNVLERWLGLARIEIQTASGSARAEMTIEGIQEFDEVRDFLYSRMRGAKEADAPAPTTHVPEEGGGIPAAGAEGSRELAGVLREIAGELRAIRIALRGATDSGTGAAPDA